MTEFRFEDHKFRWTVIDTHVVNGVKYALAESSLGDEAPCILFRVEKDKIHLKEFTNKTTGAVTTLPEVPKCLILADDIYDDIMTALYDLCII